MRVFPGIALSAALAALLAGCSGSSPSAPLLGGSSTAPARLLEYQAEGRLPSYLPRSQVQREYDSLVRHPKRPLIRAHGNAASIRIWASNPDYDYIFGLTNKGALVDSVDVSANNCRLPEGVKVDGSQNVWLACAAIGTQYSIGGIQKYTSGGAFAATYESIPFSHCPTSVTFCYYYVDVIDGAANATNVFAAIDFADTEYCYGTPCYYNYAAGFQWWPANDPSGTPTTINLYGYCLNPSCNTTVEAIGFMDLDGSGNIYFDYYYHDSANRSYGQGVAEIKNPTSASWSFVDLFPPGAGAWGCPEGVYISTKGRTQTLNVIDHCKREVFGYKLPITSSEAYTTLGPTPHDFSNDGNPVAGGFGRGDGYIAVGDEGNGDGATWIDYGAVNTNTWTPLSNFYFDPYIFGAAMTPSDKPQGQ